MRLAVPALGLVIVLAALLAGCSTRGGEGGSTAPEIEQRLSGACALPYLNVSPSAPALGEMVRIEAAIVNCGTIPLPIEPPGRCSGRRSLSVEVLFEGGSYRLDGSNPSALPTSRETIVHSCGPALLGEGDTLAPGAALRATWSWNGSLARTYSWYTTIAEPTAGYSITTTVETVAPRPGGYQLSLTFDHGESQLTWSRSSHVYVEGQEEFPAYRRMSAWRMDPSAVESGWTRLPSDPPAIVRLAANASLQSRGWHDGSHVHLGIEPAGDHYLVRERLDLGRANATFDVAIPITPAGRPLARPVEGLPDCRELPDECRVGVAAWDAERSVDNGEPARLVWHAEGDRGTFAWDVGGVLVDANDGQRIDRR